jgi:hypothetical protein
MYRMILDSIVSKESTDIRGNLENFFIQVFGQNSFSLSTFTSS